jgi:hypothetical protein
MPPEFEIDSTYAYVAVAGDLTAVLVLGHGVTPPTTLEIDGRIYALDHPHTEATRGYLREQSS